MEVIARRKNGLLALYFSLTLLGVFSFMLSAILSECAEKQNALLISGLILAVLGCLICIGILRTPKIIIRYDGEHLILREGRFTIDQLSKVNYRCAHVRGVYYRWGKIILQLDGREIVYNNVAEVENVHNRMIELMLKIRENENEKD